MKTSIGLAWIVFIVFMVLKLTHVIDWSWWWVSAPLWGGCLLVILITSILVIAGVIKN